MWHELLFLHFLCKWFDSFGKVWIKLNYFLYSLDFLLLFFIIILETDSTMSQSSETFFKLKWTMILPVILLFQILLFILYDLLIVYLIVMNTLMQCLLLVHHNYLNVLLIIVNQIKIVFTVSWIKPFWLFHFNLGINQLVNLLLGLFNNFVHIVFLFYLLVRHHFFSWENLTYWLWALYRSRKIDWLVSIDNLPNPLLKSSPPGRPFFPSIPWI